MPSPANKNALADILAQPVSAYMQKRSLVVVERNEKPLAAFNKIVTANLVSAPVRALEGRGFCGFLDIRDLVELTVLSHKASQEERDHFKAPQSNDSNMMRFLGAILSFSHKAHWVHNLGDSTKYDQGFTVQYMAKKNPFLPVLPTDSLSKVNLQPDLCFPCCFFETHLAFPFT